MQKFSLIALLAMITTVTYAQDKPASSGNGTIDAFVDSAYAVIDQQKVLGEELATIQTDAQTAIDNEDESAIEPLMARFETLKAGYDVLEGKATDLIAGGADATAASKDCGFKAPKCLKAVKSTVSVLKTTTEAIAKDKAKILEIEAKVKVAKEKYERTN